VRRLNPLTGLRPRIAVEDGFDVSDLADPPLMQQGVAGAGLEEIASWVLYLHERLDGRGYPDGLAGETIPLESRILHCADALEAVTSPRVYRPGMAIERALAELERGAGSQFDPDVAAALVALVRGGQITVRTTGRSRRA
jgi:HD-GYP domain-containing protein (c-di-GMP phosphodiesterase class II)